MWADDIRHDLEKSGEDAFYDIHYFESTDSTNEVCRRAYASGAVEGFCAIADEQTAGKGRSGHRWESPKGEAVYFSFLLKPEFAPERASSLTLVMGLSVAQAVREVLQLPVSIKWPNDIVISHRKICGILTEAVSDGKALDYVIIGTGININNTSFAGPIAETATSLRLAAGYEVNRALITAETLKCFHRNYGIFCRTADLAGLREEYNALLVSLGKEVRIEDPAGPYTAVSRGIDERGCLIIRTADGAERRIATGEVSVRGLYGYV